MDVHTDTPCFPLFISLKGKHCLVVGGGAVGLRKAKTLLRFGAKVTVAAPEVAGELMEMKQCGRLEVLLQAFEAAMLDGVFLVVAATDCRETNHRIWLAAQQRGLWINVADCPEECSFFFPAVSVQGKTVVGVSSGGVDPSLSKKLRQEIDGVLKRTIGGEVTG